MKKNPLIGIYGQYRCTCRLITTFLLAST